MVPEWVQGPFSRNAWPRRSELTLWFSGDNIMIAEALEQESELCLANRQLSDPSDAEDQCCQEETLQQVSLYISVLLLAG
jgi:hypothetical protein